MAKHVLREDPVSFDVRYDFEDALQLYKENNYIAVVVDVGDGEEIEEVLSFNREIQLLGQRAYFVFFGNMATIKRYGKQFTQIGAPAVTNNAANVIVLLKDVINKKSRIVDSLLRHISTSIRHSIDDLFHLNYAIE